MEEKSKYYIAPIVTTCITLIPLFITILLYIPICNMLYGPQESGEGIGTALGLIILLPIFFLSDIFTFVISLISFITSIVKMKKEEGAMKKFRICLIVINVVFLLVSIGVVALLYIR